MASNLIIESLDMISWATEQNLGKKLHKEDLHQLTLLSKNWTFYIKRYFLWNKMIINLNQVLKKNCVYLA